MSRELYTRHTNRSLREWNHKQIKAYSWKINNLQMGGEAFDDFLKGIKMNKFTMIIDKNDCISK